MENLINNDICLRSIISLVLLMGILCQKEETSIKMTTCSFCSGYSNSERLKTYKKCTHVLCQKCVHEIQNAQFVCPMKHKTSTSTGEAQKQQFKSVRKASQEIQQTQICTKKHKMIWRQQFESCRLCKIHLHGYKCFLCKQSVCTLCAPSFDPKKQKCPNKHSIVWRSENIPCLICGIKKHGWTCKQCRWYVCSECCDTRYNALGCPNLHSLVWATDKHNCTICRKKDRCFECSTCSAFFCPKCSGYQFSSKQCPNKHSTKQVQNHPCIKCDLYLPGMQCQQCNFHFCNRCSVEKNSSSTRQRNKDYQSIRIVIQNPLLQFQQLQKKSQINSFNLQMQNNLTIGDQSQKSEKNDLNQGGDKIQENLKSLDYYFNLAEKYRLQENYKEELKTYDELWESQNKKQQNEGVSMFQILSKALERSTNVKDRKYSILFLSRLNELSGKCQNEQLKNRMLQMQIQKVKELSLNKEITSAIQKDSELGMSQQYQQVKKYISELQL